MTERLTLLGLDEKFEKMQAKMQAEIEILRAEQTWMKRVFQTYGISGMWVSPQQAADLLCISREGVMWHVRRAERFREEKLKCECEYGVHYRQTPRTQEESNSDRLFWQIHVGNFEKLLAIPQDMLKAY